jgi:hypothetical protein
VDTGRSGRGVLGAGDRHRNPVIHTVEVAAWTIERERFVGHAAATSEWGTSRRHAGLLLEDALNASIPQIWDITTIDGKESPRTQHRGNRGGQGEARQDQGRV